MVTSAQRLVEGLVLLGVGAASSRGGLEASAVPPAPKRASQGPARRTERAL
jgi:hypothetical protein